MAWNVMKDYAHYQGNADIKGSRDATRYAFEVEIIRHLLNFKKKCRK